MEKKSIIKQSSKIKEALKKRFSELGMTYTQIAEEAETWGVKVKVETLSRYFNGQHRSSLTEEGIVFLCYRWGIPISLNVGFPDMEDGKFKTKIPPYNEKECLRITKKLWKEGSVANKQTVKNDTGAPGQKRTPDADRKK